MAQASHSHRTNGRRSIEKTQLPKQRSLEILPPEDDQEMRPASACSTSSSRPNSSSSRRAPPVNKQDRIARTPTPTKSILLEAVKRKEETGEMSENMISRRPNSRLLKSSSAVRSQSKQSSSDEYEKHLEHEQKDKQSASVSETIAAPTELFLEFLQCVMTKDYANAHKLCRMVLLYEPSNPQALQFQPLLEEKMKQEEELNCDTGSGDDTSSEGSDDDEGSTDDEGVELTSSDGSSSSSEEEEEGEDEEEEEEDHSAIQDEHKV